MLIACPECNGSFEAESSAREVNCPHCKADLDPAVLGATMALTPDQLRASERLSASREHVSGLGTVDGPPIKQFGDYEIQAELGRGGMGVVYKAFDPQLKRTVALKVLIAAEHASGDEVKRFFREAESAAKLQHPNIVPIHELKIHEGKHYYTMDFIEGRPLDVVLKSGKLDLRRNLELLEKVAAGLEHAHSHGIVHRDLKPSNIIVDASGEPRIFDFGLAKVLDVEGQAPTGGLTQSGVAMGTPHYMAPEQAAGRSKEVDARTDVYAMGCILYEVLTGRPPFVSTNAMEVIRDQMESDPVPPRNESTKVPTEVETICLKCLAKEPDRRYSSAADLAADLRRYLDGKPIAARPASLLYRVRKRVARNLGTVLASVGAACIVALLALGWAAWGRDRSPGAAAGGVEGKFEARLRAANPGYNGRGKFRMKAGSIVEADLAGAGVRYLKPLAGLKLTGLDCSGNQVRELDSLKGMPLAALKLKACPVSDLAPLAGMKLKSLDLSDTKAVDLGPLKDMPLEELNLSGSGVADLAPLKGMKLRRLEAAGTGIKDLAALKGMPLAELDLRGTAIADLSPLKGMPLTSLRIGETNVSDLRPLRGMKLEALQISPAKIKNGADVLRAMKSLKVIASGDTGWKARQSAADFWRKRRLAANPVKLSAMRSNQGWMITFQIMNFRVKEIFYRLGEKGEFKSTGHMAVTNTQTGLPMANMTLTLPLKQEGTSIYVKWTDDGDASHGPHALKFDPGLSMVKSTKNILGLTAGSWVAMRDYNKKLLLYFTHLISYRGALKEVRYSLDNDKLDKVFPLPPGTEMRIPSGATIYLEIPLDTKKVFVKLKYRDDTESEVRSFERR